MLFDDMKVYKKAESFFYEDWQQKKEIIMT